VRCEFSLLRDDGRSVLGCADVRAGPVLIKASFLGHDYGNQGNDYLPRLERHVSNGVQNAEKRVVMPEILWIGGNRVMSSSAS
jgi:hypothetical protein